MPAKIAKWGNSAGVRIPAAALDAAGLSVGDEVDVVAREGGGLELRPRWRPQTVQEIFAEHLKKYGKLEPPPLVDWGPSVGSEIIDDGYSRGEITLEDLLKEDDGTGRR